MRTLVLTLTAALLLSSCVSSRTVQESTDLREMAQCEFVGNIKASFPHHMNFQFMTSPQAYLDLAKEKAAQRGATHIVFDARGARVGAKAYRCPAPSPAVQMAP